MPAKINGIIYGKDKKITLEKFNVGSLAKAITFDLEESGKKGVQGVAIKTTDANNKLITARTPA